jgi:hypothetical protein
MLSTALSARVLGHTRDHARHLEHEHVHRAEHDGHDHAPSEVEEGALRPELDITEDLRAVEDETEEIPLKLVAVDGNGVQVEAQDVLFEDIELDVD